MDDPRVPESRGRLLIAVAVGALVFFAARYAETYTESNPSGLWVANVVAAVVAALFVVAGPDWTQAITAVVTALATVAALLFSVSALNLAQSNEDRLDRQDDQRFAEKIHVGEPPASVYEDRSEEDCTAARASDEADCHPRVDGRIWQVVINPGGIQVEDVLVTNKDRDEYVRIGGLERCSMYYLPHWVSDDPDEDAPDSPGPGSVDFDPGDLYFTDPVGHWRRPVGGQVSSVSDQDFDALLSRLGPADNGIAPYSDVLPDCAG